MKKIFLLILLCVSSVSAIDRITLIRPIRSGQTVLIQLDGQIHLSTTSASRIKIRTTVKKSGKTWGWKKRPKPFRCKWTESGDTLIFTSEQRGSSVSFGITTYSETIIHNISLPSWANVIIQSKKSELTVTGSMKNLSINIENGSVHAAFEKQHIRFLECQCNDGQVFTPKVNNNRLQWHGPGSRIINIALDDGNIHLFLNEPDK
ncbi:hypothetical protein KAR48_15020 [bacterium]|nr:hypothetical protein [bacterium]